MPTYNSEGTIRLALESIVRQEFDPGLIEVLVVDGGSVDRTIDIATEFGCTVLTNDRMQPEYGKLVGLKNARGRYALFLDSDEVLLQPHSLRDKIALLSRTPSVKNVITAGLKTPDGYSSINDYINSYGEPFSYFMYRIDGSDYFQSLRKHYRVAEEDADVLILEFDEGDVMPICDGGAHCFDLEYLKQIADISDPKTIPSIFSRMAQRTRRLAVLKNDFTVHYSTTTLRRYLNKIKWRVISNAHGAGGNEAFIQRQSFAPRWFSVKKYLFLIYSFTLIGPLLDALALTAKRKKATFLLHFPLSVYTAAFIGFQYLLRALGIHPKLKSYGS